MRLEVTAVITTHARPASVHEAIESVLGETHNDCEVIVVDDGGAFVPPVHFAPSIRVIRGSNLGVGRARNLGLAAARGEFIVYLDDDDIAMPHRIHSLVDAARRHNAVLCFGMTRRTLDGTTLLEDVPTDVVSGAIGFGDLLTCAPHVNAVLARTDTLRAIGGFDAGCDHFDDWSAWLRIADRDEVIWRIEEVVAEWRIHSEGLSARVLTEQAMKSRILSLFRRLRRCLSPDNARAIAWAERVVHAAQIDTYDDYVAAMVAAQQPIKRVPAVPSMTLARARVP